MMKAIYRAPKRADAAGLLAFINELATEDTYIIITEKQTLKKERKWLDEQLKAIGKRNAVMVVAEVDGKIVGNCQIRRRVPVGRARHTASFGISVLKKYRGKGIGEGLMRRTIAEAKKRMGITLLTLSAFANNPIAPNLYRKLGFRECGRLPGAFLFKGKYVDEIYMFRKVGK